MMFFCTVLAACSLSACGSGASGGVTAEAGDRMQIVTTIFPEYDWVVNVLGEERKNADVTLLMDNGVDLHSYQPTTDDILKISSCDVFLYVGGESDGWVDDALREAINKDMVVINLLDLLGDKAKEEEIVEGMQAEEEEEEEDPGPLAGSEQSARENDRDEVEYDEHVWLSVKNAAFYTDKIAEALSKADPVHADAYGKNAKAYIEKLTELDNRYEKEVAAAANKTVLFGDRFPFRYLVDDYGISYYAAFVGCSAETEASFETVTFLSGKVDELQLPAVMVIENSDQKIAKTIVDNTSSKDQQILVLDSMQSVTSKDMAGGTTYLSVMEKNLDVLKGALR
ncbi:MAG: zinc ABC transporter substrate-binding protein [Lachnospiraceae bacterium]|nr:zinc ABC transporter substrate-binding protein [Lachnospiraceae bacterium]